MSSLEIDLEQMTILVADPQDGARRVISEMLHALGARNVIAVGTLEQASERMVTACVDALICDYRLGGNRGAEFIRTLRSDRSHVCRAIPVLMTCGHTRLRDVRESRDCGANLVLVKPYSVTALYDRLAWMAHRPRPFVSSGGYNGPSRRFQDFEEDQRPSRRRDDPPIDAPAGTRAVGG